MADKLNNNYRSVYDLSYQFIIRVKVFFGRKILRFKQWEMNHIIDFINTHGHSKPILDIGCSTGHMVEELSQHFGEG